MELKSFVKLAKFPFQCDILGVPHCLSACKPMLNHSCVWHRRKNQTLLIPITLKKYIGFHLAANLQSGAGHQRVSGSAARNRRSWNSSKRSSKAPSSRMARTSGSARASGHCGQAMPTRLSKISMRRYWRKQSVQARCWQEDRRGKWPRGWLSRQSGHSTRCSSSCSWLEEDKDSTPIEPLLPHSAPCPPSPTPAWSAFPRSPPSLSASLRMPPSLWAWSWEETDV